MNAKRTHRQARLIHRIKCEICTDLCLNVLAELLEMRMCVCVCASFVFPFFHRLLFRDFNYNFVSFQWNRFQLWLWPVEWGGVGSFAKMTWEKAAPLHTGNPTKQLHGVCLLLRICRDIVPKRNLRGERRVEWNAAIIIHYLETIQLLWRSN